MILMVNNLELKGEFSHKYMPMPYFRQDYTLDDINIIAGIVADLLDVDIPTIQLMPGISEKIGGKLSISYNSNQDVKDAEMFLYEEYLIYKDEESRIMLIETIAHEMRHYWQAIYWEMEDINGEGDIYSKSEIDSRAYAELFKEFILGLVIKTEYDDDKIQRLVDKRRRELYDDFVRRIKKIMKYEFD